MDDMCRRNQVIGKLIDMDIQDLSEESIDRAFRNCVTPTYLKRILNDMIQKGFTKDDMDSLKKYNEYKDSFKTKKIVKNKILLSVKFLPEKMNKRHFLEELISVFNEGEILEIFETEKEYLLGIGNIPTDKGGRHKIFNHFIKKDDKWENMFLLVLSTFVTEEQPTITEFPIVQDRENSVPVKLKIHILNKPGGKNQIKIFN